MSHPKMLHSKSFYKRKRPDIGIMERFSTMKFEDIPITSTKNKVDAFRAFQPKYGEVLDYTISETDVKMEHKGVHINYKETKAEYVPAPEEYMKKRQMRSRTVYSHGGPPQWKFIDEVWLENQERMQKFYKNEFETYKKMKKIANNCNVQHKHALLLSLAGPEWYQELSPRQLMIVDTFDECIQKDLKNKSICFTQKAIARLGLVCRPHHKKVEVALKNCCGSSVEFLCILYQLLDPHRKEYSLNDRLLLSAVVHLNITQILRELHIRIPSPVRHKKETIITKKPIRKKTYISPYLEPYTFKPNPPKFTGVYYKKHVQHPQSLYFSYIDSLRKEQCVAKRYSETDLADFSEDEKEFIKETIQAQELYNKIQCSNEVTLLKPTKLKRCIKFEYYQKLLNEKCGKVNVITPINLPPLQDLERMQVNCECPNYVERPRDNIHNEDSKCDCKKEISTEVIVSSFCTECSWKKEHKKINGIVIGITVVACTEVIPIHGGIYIDTNCYCKEQLENEQLLLKTKNTLKNLNQKYVNNGVVISAIGPVYYMTTAIWSDRLKKLLKMPVQEKKMNTMQNNPSISSQQVSYQEPCSFCEKVEQEENNLSSEPVDDSACQCKREIDNFLKSKCICEECNVERRRKEATYIVSGLQDMENEPPLNIVHGIQDCQCNCLYKYLEKMRRVEEYRKRCQLVYDLRKKSVKYTLGGVTNTDEGPIYQISGMRQPVQCICLDALKKEEELQEYLKRFPKMPPTGRIKYGITGIQLTPEENFFIISQALDSPECDCEKLYEEFIEEHTNCWDAYENFLKDMETKRTEYFVEFGNENIMKLDNLTDNLVLNEQDNFEAKVMSGIERGMLERNEDSPVRSQLPPCNLKMPYEVDGGVTNQRCKCRQRKPAKSEFCAFPRSESVEKSNNQNEECSCECNKSDLIHFDSNYAIRLDSRASCDKSKEKPQFSDRSVQQEDTKEKLKRFRILKEFPRCAKTQQELIKEVLAEMAEDGFLLAKLPDCHKLPHFKLWVELRCGKIWTQKDIANYFGFSKYAWKHTDYCYDSVKTPNAIFKPKLLTWKSAEYCKGVVNTMKNRYYRMVKQKFINKSREFFPTMFLCEFPSKQVRQAFFAYLPSKEEDLIYGI